MRRKTSSRPVQPSPAPTASSASWPARLRRWARSALLQWLVVLALALGVRLWHLHEARALPMFEALLSDAQSYAIWAQQIVAGDWLSAARGTFYQAPLYPYLLALVLGAGGDFWTARLLQALAGALACGLVASSARRMFGPGAGWASGLLLAIYAPAIFADGMVGKESVAMLGMAVLVRLLVGVITAARARTWLGIGITLGLLVLLRENFALLVGVLGLWLWIYPPARPLRLRLLAVLALGLGLVLLPVAARNAWVGGDFTLSTAQGGPNYYIGNHPGASGTYEPLRAGRSDTPLEQRDARELAERATGRALTPGEVSSYWFGRSLAYLRNQPGAWLALQARKLWMVLHAYELPDAEDLYLYTRPGTLLGALHRVGHWGVLLPLALLGALLSGGQWRRLLPLYGCLLVGLASIALFFVLGRYRLPLVPLVAFFAGAGVALGWNSLRVQAMQRTWWSLAAAGLCAVLVNWPRPGWIDPGGMRQVNLGVAYARQGQYPQALQHYQLALQLQPGLPEAHLNLGNLLAVLGDIPRAIPHLETAVAAAPDDAEAAQLLAQVLLLHPQRSAAEVQRALQLATGLCPPQRCEDLVRLALRVEAVSATGDAAALGQTLDEAIALAQRRQDAARLAEWQARRAALP